MTRFLVIGASSFTGGHFCDYLRQRHISFEHQSLREIFSHADIIDRPECIVNFAAANVVSPSWQHPEDYLRVNVIRLMPIIEYLRRHPHTKYVHVSTPEVYGSTNGCITEAQEFNPSTPYAASRAAAEMLLNVFAKEEGIPLAITRGCNVYGPRQQLYRLIPKLIVSIRKGEKFMLEGGGRSMRSWLYVSDMVDAIYRVATAGFGPYHIAPEGMQSVFSIAHQICLRMGVKLEDAIRMTADRPGKDFEYNLDATRIKALGWQPTIALEQGIDNVIDWVDRNWPALKDQRTTYEFKP